MAGKPNRDRGRRTERAHPTPPAEVSVERVDAHTLILRTPRPLDDEGLTFLADVASAYAHGAKIELRRDAQPVEVVDRPGVWLTPGEVVALEAGTPFESEPLDP